MYQTKFIQYALLLIVLAQGSWAAQPTLHAIIVADTNDTEIGAIKDEEAMKKLMEDIDANTCLELSMTTIDSNFVDQGGGGYNRVKSAVENLAVNPQDVVIFYYSGHGANSDTKSRWPTLGVEGKTTPFSKRIELSWVKDTLKAKKPRLFIAMADACNKFPISTSSSGSRSHKSAQKSAYEQLFLDYSGYVIASSSGPDQYSFGYKDSGGLFTNQFLDSLRDGLISPNPDWENIMTKATKEIQIPDNPQGKQNPQKDVQVVKSSGARGMVCATTPIPSPLDDTPVRGTCANSVYYPKGGERCCKDEGGKEHCFND